MTRPPPNQTRHHLLRRVGGAGRDRALACARMVLLHTRTRVTCVYCEKALWRRNMVRSSKGATCRCMRTLDIFTITSRMLATASFSRRFSADKASRSSWSLNRGKQRYYTFVRAHTFSLSVSACRCGHAPLVFCHQSFVVRRQDPALLRCCSAGLAPLTRIRRTTGCAGGRPGG